MARIDRIMEATLIAMIKLYRFWLSPWFGNACRFEPSCSRYAEQAIHLHGTMLGLKLTLKRVFKCHPWHPGGFDSVPLFKK